MERLYLVLMIVFIVAAVLSIGVYVFFMLHEKRIKEVTTGLLHSMGKDYTKEFFETELYNQFVNIEEAKVSDNYTFLKDVVSDEEYNNILLDVKRQQEESVKKINTSFTKYFSKLIDFKIVGNQEVAKLWIQFSDIEYTKGYTQESNEKGEVFTNESIVSGSDKKPVTHEYVLTYVKDRSTTERVVCPS